MFLNYRDKKQIEKIRKIPFKAEHRKLLLKIPHYKNLSDTDKRKIERSIIRFAYTKEFVGVKMEITDEMKIIISFYACLLLLHLQTDNCYDNLKAIIVYPSPVVMKNVKNNGGIYTQEDFILDGQSANDTVVLVWHDAKYEAYHLRHDNVIIHEFAHEIDFMDGEIDGVPPLARSKYHAWTFVLYDDYQKLNNIAAKNREWGKYKLLGSYAATNEAEFFAVVTERFFESPHSLKSHFPELYNELKDFYKIDTLSLVEKQGV
ncbi:zinc-dependent peptidase [Sulfurovum sp.]|uniref:M90 family metallopeptidase n=1 Tax=Sulfurovum sp. TaxID=1969726 RepID=UPI0025E0961C|nr:M90 family metallopeptidase [Sulfurovum sp.]